MEPYTARCLHRVAGAIASVGAMCIFRLEVINRRRRMLVDAKRSSLVLENKAEIKADGKGH
jgi:hypothetical protein